MYVDTDHTAATTPREWLVEAQRQLEHLLPARHRRSLLTDQMVDSDGEAVDVYRYFGERLGDQSKLMGNWNGFLQTAQQVGADSYIDKPPPDWPGFEDVWVPVADDVQLAGRLGLVRSDSNITEADCIVIVPGFMGDLGGQRTRDVALALRENGFHVLALDLRGHGRTEHRYPDMYYSYGVIETRDLLRTSRWLRESFACVRRTGLLGYCWGGNLAMLTAWLDNRGEQHPGLSEHIALFHDAFTGEPHYTAGVMAISPVINFEAIVERTEQPRDLIDDPNTHFFQQTIEGRMRLKQFPNPDGNLRRLIDLDFSRSVFGPALNMTEPYQFFRLLPHNNHPTDDKLESARVPTLIVSSINDPFLNIQEVADLIALTENPNVAAIILSQGGHVGLAAFNRSYTYSLILSFFHPEHGAARLNSATEHTESERTDQRL